MEFSQKKFSSPQEEIEFLRAQIAERERDLLSRQSEIDHADHETIGREVLRSYAEHDPSIVLEKKHVMEPEHIAEAHHLVDVAFEKIEEVITIAEERGIRNALSVLEKVGDPFLTDEVHKHMVQILRTAGVLADLKEDQPLWRVLNMTLYEIALPQHSDASKEMSLKMLLSGMEQFYAGMQTVAMGKVLQTYALEIAVSDNRDDIIFYVAIPNEYVNLFEKQALSLFPHAVLLVQQNDYNIFVAGGEHLLTVLDQKKHPIYPLKTYEAFDIDPMLVVLNAFSKIERHGGGAAIQIVVGGGSRSYQSTYGAIVKRIKSGDSVETSIRKSTVVGSVFEDVKSVLRSTATEKPDTPAPAHDTDALSLFEEKLKTPILDTNIRLVVSAKTKERAEQIMTELESSFHQFELTRGNRFVMKHIVGMHQTRELKAFSFREFIPARRMPLSLAELATIIHFPSEGIESSPQFKQSRAKQAPAPVDMPQSGTLLGENTFRNATKKIYLTPEDRLRHLYVIGQTGTGKTTLLKNMIVQDIQDGAGVCMIDPHGTDIVDVLSAIPQDRLDDVIYFDPSNLSNVIGLNMLEFDARFPEQKTFVVNELFSMFQKLYSANPESMGPMFEQYFRNSTLLVLEDVDSGATLLDISRVMSDADYRNYKLSKAKNPVVRQFWEKIASKSTGEQSLENFVPYIVSKIDPLTANDYMRPIIGQQKSSFNFRDIMDSRKILLVNLAKGRLGEINANLIGMVIVGKILMAALSRVDDVTRGFAPFYLYIDEFQNVTTDSISSILSEARKYKLGLTIAHQYIAQIDEKIRDAVFGNVGSMAVFRVGTDDAEFLASQFDPVFTATDLVNVENRNAYVRLLSNGSPTQPFSIHTMKPHPTDFEYATQIMEYSALRYGRARDTIEAEIQARYQ